MLASALHELVQRKVYMRNQPLALVYIGYVAIDIVANQSYGGAYSLEGQGLAASTNGR